MNGSCNRTVLLLRKRLIEHQRQSNPPLIKSSSHDRQVCDLVGIGQLLAGGLADETNDVAIFSSDFASADVVVLRVALKCNRRQRTMNPSSDRSALLDVEENLQ